MTDKKAIKSVGEFWTCTKLAMDGWSPALTRDGLERTDILAARTVTPFAVSHIEVQVKTSTYNKWYLNPIKIGVSRDENEWFVLVQWNQEIQTLTSYIVPRNHVSAGAWLAHMQWLHEKDTKRKRNCGVDQARIGTDVFDSYKERWDLLTQKTSSVEILLPSWMHETALREECKLPDWHPWSVDLPQW